MLTTIRALGSISSKLCRSIGQRLFSMIYRSSCKRKGEAVSEVKGRMANADRSEAADNCASWYAIWTRSHFEPTVAADLAAKGIECYLPAVREVHQWKDRKKAVDVPLFPGYVFVRFLDTDQARLQVLRSRGAVRILGHDNAVEPIPNEQIDAVRLLLESQRPFSVHPLLREGAIVRVKAGPLKGVEG